MIRRRWIVGLALLLTTSAARAETGLIMKLEARSAQTLLDELRRLGPLVRAHLPRILAVTTPPAGLNPAAPAELELVPGGVLVLGLHVADRDAVDAWLESQGDEPEEGIFLVWAHAPEALCGRDQTHLWCQIGVADDGVRPLRRALRAEPQAPVEGHWALQAKGPALAEWFLHWELALARRDMRYECPERRRARLRRALRLAQARQDLVGPMQALELIRRADGLELELELSPAAANRLSRATAPIDPRVAGWTQGPSLLSGFSRLPADFVASWVEALASDETGPVRADGCFALAAFGFDPYHWASELALPLRIGALLSGAVALPSADSSTTSLHLRRQVSGTPMESLRHDGVIVLGYGHGAGPAAVRRLKRSQPLPVPEELLVHGRLDLQAVRAALESIPEPALDRPELRWLRELQLTARAWPRSVRSLELDVRRLDETRVQARLQALP